MVARHDLGKALAARLRPMRSRSHAVELALQPGAKHLLLLQVASDSALVLPVRLARPETFRAQESREQLLQGVLNGFALALLAYSLSNWLRLRDPLFLQYALLLAGVTTVFTSSFGIGHQHLWPQQSGLLAKIGRLSVLLATAGTLDYRSTQTLATVLGLHIAGFRRSAQCSALEKQARLTWLASIARWACRWA